MYSKMIAKVSRNSNKCKTDPCNLATECMIRNANKRVSVVALARFRCRFCTKSLLSILLRRTCERFRDRWMSTVLFIRKRYGKHGWEMCAEQRQLRERQTRREESLRQKLQRCRSYFNAECFEPSAEWSLRNSRCKASKLENENAAEGVKACVTPKLVRSVRLCRNVTQVSIMDALRRTSNAFS